VLGNRTQADAAAGLETADVGQLGILVEGWAVFAEDRFAGFALNWVYWHIATYSTLQNIAKHAHERIAVICSALGNASLKG
jgi:hypothetical protein